MSTPLHFLTIDAASRRIASGTLSPVTLVEAVAERIAAVDPRLDSYILPTIESARAEARRAEAEIAAGRRIGPLHGIPIGVKDIVQTAGVRTTCHSHILADAVPAADAVVLARLKAAGAIVMGKLATHEFAFGGPDWTLPFPPARNPWNRNHFTAGSSVGFGRGRRGRPVPRRARQRHGGLDPNACRLLRHRWDQADLRPRLPPRRLSARLQPGPYRADVLDGARLRPDAAGDGRP
jgi:hypothetical protein